MTAYLEHKRAKHTEFAFLCMRLMGTPCWCLLSMLAFILYKNEHVTPFQIAVIVALKPATSLLSPYWSQAIYQRPDKIVTNLMGANFFRHFLFLFVPFIHNSWFVVLAFGLYMMLSRATIPAWMELFKYNLPKTRQEQLIGYATTIDYLGTAILSVGAGFLLDHFAHLWRWFFFLTSILGLTSTFLLTSVKPSVTSRTTVPVSFNLNEKISNPWKQVWQLIRYNREFTIFQIGFMFGGAGLMIMQPAFPEFFIDTLHLSFVEMGLAIALCKGIGVALTSSLWTKLFRKINIFSLCSVVTFFAALFPFLLLTATWHLALLYLAYAFYGIMQAGSELSWHMSGLVFAGEKDSSTFSVTNVLTVGIRGCVIPTVGSLLLSTMQPIGVILIGALLCLFASSFFFIFGRPKRVLTKN